jgi:MFS family permease
MVIALWFFGAIQCGISCAYLDAAPVFSTIMNTIGNMMGAIAGLLVPLAVSMFTNTFDDKAGWRITFFFTASLSASALVLWKVFITSEIVPALNTPIKRDTLVYSEGGTGRRRRAEEGCWTLKELGSGRKEGREKKQMKTNIADSCRY